MILLYYTHQGYGIGAHAPLTLTKLSMTLLNHMCLARLSQCFWTTIPRGIVDQELKL